MNVYLFINMTNFQSIILEKTSIRFFLQNFVASIVDELNCQLKRSFDELHCIVWNLFICWSTHDCTRCLNIIFYDAYLIWLKSIYMSSVQCVSHIWMQTLCYSKLTETSVIWQLLIVLHYVKIWIGFPLIVPIKISIVL